MKKILCSLIVCLFYATSCFAAVSGEVLINGQDPTATGTIITPVRTYDAGKLTADAQTKGVLAVGPLMYNGTNWDRLRGDATNGLKTQGTLTGTVTPSDTFANPTTAVVTYSLIGGWDGTQWVRISETAIGSDAVPAVTALSTFNYSLIYNPASTVWNRMYTGINTGQALTDSSSNASNIISTDTTTTVKATGGILNAVFINTAGTAPASITFYNIAAAGCTGTPASGNTMTIQTITLNQIVTINHTFTLGICAVTTAGASKANISVLYR